MPTLDGSRCRRLLEPLPPLADVFQLLIQSHIVWLHTTGDVDKTDLAPSTISLPSLHQPESKLGLHATRNRIRAQFTKH